MEYNIIVQLISSVGFPIVACCALFWQMNQQDTRHKEEIDSLRETIEKNTNAIEKLIAKL